MPQNKLQLPIPLTGEALLQRVRDLADLPREQKARLCGYSMIADDGTEYVDMMQFIVAVLEANGVQVGQSSEDSRDEGWRASYRLTVQPDSSLVIDAAYTKLIDLQPGDELAISLGKNHVYLNPIDRVEEDLSKGFIAIAR